MSGPVALLGTLLLWFLSPGGSVKSSRYVYTEVIVPRLLRSGDNLQKADVSYLLKVEGKYQIVHLRHITFVVPNMPVYSYNMKGDRIADYPYIQDDCYYSGSVEDVVDSQAVFSICNGLWGHVQIERLSYEIEPIENSPTFQHLIYRRAQEDHEPCRGILEDGGNWTSDFAQITTVGDGNAVSSDWEGENLEFHARVRYLEFYIVVDRSKALTQKQNETQLVRNILIVMADVHSIYLEIGLHVYLVGLELWTERDYIVMGKTLPETLKEFQTYASYQLLHRISFDHSSLITAQGHGLGITSAEHYCQPNHASVSVIRSVGSLKSDADQMAHELGHSLGFFHDDAGRLCHCRCSQRPGSCIMRSDYSAGACRRLSNCSRRVYYDLIRKPGKECLLNKPSQVSKPTICGNGVLDRDEECDCGHNEECRSSGCCQTNCKLAPGADCLDGACCEKCKYLPEGTTCRTAATKCDLAEYCSGTTANCPPDVYKQDGTPCGRSASCYTGQCFDLQQHCMALFGKDANLAPLSCFKEVNTRGDRSGNCGEEGLKFKKCEKQDVLCGRLQCTDVDRIPRLSTGQAVLQTPVENIMCWGTEYHPGLDAYDLGAVRDGSSCGADKVCINRSCVSREVLKYDCDLNRCHKRGVCNNRKNCHCAYGWAPPFCKGKGYGGSVDSGPPPMYSSNLALIIAVVALIGVVLFAVLAISVLKREQLKAWFDRTTRTMKQEPPQPEPMSEPEDTQDPTQDLEPEPLPELQHMVPAKHTQLEPGPQPPYPPQPQLSPQQEPRPLPPHPGPLAEPQRTSPVKRMLSQRASPAKGAPRLEPRPRPQYPAQPQPPQPEPRPQPPYPPQPKPQPEPQRTSSVKHTLSQRTSLAKHAQLESRPQPQYPAQPQRPSQRELRPQPPHPPQLEPTPQPQYPSQREPRLQPEQTKARKPTQKPSRGSS